MPAPFTYDEKSIFLVLKFTAPHKRRSSDACGPELSEVEVTGPTTATATVVAPASVVPVKYFVAITFDDGRAYTFEVQPDSKGMGNIDLINLEPCTTYFLSVQAVLVDGTKSPGANASFTTPSA
jgi:hypothetical protein